MLDAEDDVAKGIRTVEVEVVVAKPRKIGAPEARFVVIVLLDVVLDVVAGLIVVLVVRIGVVGVLAVLVWTLSNAVTLVRMFALGAVVHRRPPKTSGVAMFATPSIVWHPSRIPTLPPHRMLCASCWPPILPERGVVPTLGSPCGSPRRCCWH